jgi:hypothetical protein
MPRYAHVSKNSSIKNLPYSVIDENGRIVAECESRSLASVVRDEYDAHRNISVGFQQSLSS